MRVSKANQGENPYRTNRLDHYSTEKAAACKHDGCDARMTEFMIRFIHSTSNGVLNVLRLFSLHTHCATSPPASYSASVLPQACAPMAVLLLEITNMYKDPLSNRHWKMLLAALQTELPWIVNALDACLALTDASKQSTIAHETDFDGLVGDHACQMHATVLHCYLRMIGADQGWRSSVKAVISHCNTVDLSQLRVIDNRQTPIKVLEAFNFLPMRMLPIDIRAGLRFLVRIS